jgi:hypothetical protein
LTTLAGFNVALDFAPGSARDLDAAERLERPSLPRCFIACDVVTTVTPS